MPHTNIFDDSQYMSSSLCAPRIGIVGAGIGGLSLAGILPRKLPHAKLSVLEQAKTGTNGLDLDEWGQEALVRAGVFDKDWPVSRPHPRHHVHLSAAR